MYFSLEEVISCPPSLISSRSEKPGDDTKAKKTSEASGFSGVKRSVLSGWCERPSIQEFINTVSSLSLKKKQQENIEQQLHLQEQKQKQEQLQYQKHQQQKLQQFQQQNNPVDNSKNTNSSCSDYLQLTGFLKEITSSSQPQKVGDVNLPESCQRKPKVRKVMKGGILVSMPCTTRHPTGGKSVEKVNDFCSGNILDDILARAKDNKQENLQDTVSKTLKKTSKCSESMVKISSTSSTDINPLNKEKINEKPVESAEALDQSSVSEQHSSKITEGERTETDCVTKQIENIKFDWKNKEVIANSITKSIDDEASKVNSSKDKVTDANGKEYMTIENKKKPTPLKRNFEDKTTEETAELKIENIKFDWKNKEMIADSITKSIDDEASKVNSSKDKVIDANGKEYMTIENKNKPTPLKRNFEGKTTEETAEMKNQGKAVHSSSTSSLTFEIEENVMTQQTESIVMPETSLIGHESDSSMASGELVIDCEPISLGTEDEKSFRQPKKCRFTSSESSIDLEMPSSFDRIRSLQCNDDVFMDKDEKCELTNNVEHSCITSEGALSDEDEKSLKEIQETCLNQGRTKSNAKLNEKQLDKEDFSEKHKIVTRMAARKMSTDFTDAQTEQLNDDVLPDVSMVVQTQCPETRKMDDKMEENDRKRKESMDEMSSGVTLQCKNTGITGGPVKSLIQTKRKGTCKKIIRPSQYEKSVTKSQTNSGEPHKDTTIQDNKVAKFSPTDKEGMEKPEHTVPSLSSMVSNEVLDITVIEKELVNKRSVGRKKNKKRNKPTEWFLRKQKREQEMKYNAKPLQSYIPPVCIFFRKGNCSMGDLCRFTHEKTRELCSYYAGIGECYKFNDGMCPNLHNEFPCKFFHINKFCRNEDDCRFSHETLTEETKANLDNYLLTLQQKNELLEGDAKALEFNSSVTEFKEICSTDGTGGYSSSASIPVPPSLVYTQPPDTNAHNPVPTETSSKLSNSPKVKRLCSLSSYKPQVLFSLTSTIKSPDHSNSVPSSECNPRDSPQTKAEETSTSKTAFQFLPGLFKER